MTIHTYEVTVTFPRMTYRQSVTTLNPMLALSIVGTFFAAGVMENATSITCVCQ